MPDRPDDPGPFVRHGDRRLGPSAGRGDRHGPLLEACQSIGRALGQVQRHTRHGARAMDQQTAKVHIPPLTNAPEIAPCTCRQLTRRQPQPAGEVTPPTKRVNVTNGSHQCGRRQHANPRNRLEPGRDGMRAGDLPELAIESGDLLLESVDFVDDERHRLTQQVGARCVRVTEDGGHATEHGPRADRDRVAVFSQQPSPRIDPGHTCGLPLSADHPPEETTEASLLQPASHVDFCRETCTGRDSQRGRHVGLAVLGLGLVFFGLHYMGQAVKPLRDNERFMQFMTGLERPLIGVAAGTVATIAIQSSSAMLGIVITLASHGLLTLAAGLAIMLGAEIGTCADTLVAAIGRTRAAIRAGLFHLGFNLVTAAASGRPAD
jgi:Na+/Pi-cotransporter